MNEPLVLNKAHEMPCAVCGVIVDTSGEHWFADAECAGCHSYTKWAFCSEACMERWQPQHDCVN